jgi:membrane associated rhomboid family serine protease
MLIPFQIRSEKQYWRFFTSIISHGDEMHLIFNMYTLYIFVEKIEPTFANYYPDYGKQLFLLLYIGAGLFASIYPYLKHRYNPNYRALGASGAVSALIFCFILLAPFEELIFLFLPIPLPAWLFGLLYLAFEIYAHKQNKGGIAHDAHIGGAVFGIIFTIVFFFQVVAANIQSLF